jgi:hypothetical protein
MNQKFKLGDRVTTKQIGLPITGEIVAIMTPLVHNIFLYNKEKVGLDFWTKFCSWEDDPVYCIRLDTPSRGLSFEEFCSQQPKCMHSVEIYEHTTPYTYNVMHPEADIELLEENE